MRPNIEAPAHHPCRKGIRAPLPPQRAYRLFQQPPCATLSATPLIRGAWLKPGSHLDLVGAFHPGLREADDEALRRTAVYIDAPAALSEGGDVAMGLQSGAIAAADVRGDLFGLCRGQVQGRTRADEITLFKSVGAALEDLTAATLVWRSLAPTS